MNFREATINDCEEIDNLLTKLIDDERINYDNTLQEGYIVKNFYEKYINDNDKKIYVCVDEDKIVGYIYIIINDNIIAKLDALYVLEEHRNKGIAKELIKMAINYIKQNKAIRRIEINVLSENKIAKKLYEKINFKPFRLTMRLDK